MAKSTKGQNYFHGAAILTAGVIIMKILGAIYKIPLGNILGDEGYSMFMGAYSIYFIFFTLAIADILLSRPEPMHDLLQKAAGWLVREVGNHDEQIMKDWLEPRYHTMPRTMLRYCIEKLDDTDRLHFMQKTR